jgi:steroid 5-alpha reductase family enzyme
MGRMVQNYATEMERTEPDMRPLGALALGAAILSAVLSVTYFFSFQAYLAAVIALPLGLMSRSHERSCGMGNVAIMLAVFTIAAASATLIWI